MTSIDIVQPALRLRVEQQSANNQVTSTTIGATNTATAYASELASTYQFTTSFCGGPGTASQPATICFACCLPFACPSSRPCTEESPIQHKSRFSLPHPPHHSMLSLSIFLTDPNTVRTPPLSLVPVPFFSRAAQLPKGAPVSP